VFYDIMNNTPVTIASSSMPTEGAPTIAPSSERPPLKTRLRVAEACSSRATSRATSGMASRAPSIATAEPEHFDISHAGQPDENNDMAIERGEIILPTFELATKVGQLKEFWSSLERPVVPRVALDTQPSPLPAQLADPPLFACTSNRPTPSFSGGRDHDRSCAPQPPKLDKLTAFRDVIA